MNFLAIVILHVLIFPSCNGNAVELSCIICESSPQNVNQTCADGRMLDPVQCSDYYETKYSDPYTMKRKKRRYFLCALKITQKATVYGFYYNRTCIVDREAPSFCTNSKPDEQRYRHCSTCTNEACNKAPKAMFEMIAAVSSIIVLICRYLCVYFNII